MAAILLPNRRRVGITDATLGTGIWPCFIWRPEQRSSSYPWTVAPTSIGADARFADTEFGTVLRTYTTGTPAVLWQGVGDPFTTMQTTLLTVARFRASGTYKSMLFYTGDGPGRQYGLIGNCDYSFNVSSGRVTALSYDSTTYNSVYTSESTFGDWQYHVFVYVKRAVNTSNELWIDGRQPAVTAAATNSTSDYHLSSSISIGGYAGGGYINDAEIALCVGWNAAISPAHLADLHSPSRVISKLRGWAPRRTYLDLGVTPVTRAPGLGSATLTGAAGSLAFNPGDYIYSTATPDDEAVVELTDLQTPGSGTWTMKVRGRVN